MRVSTLSTFAPVVGLVVLFTGCGGDDGLTAHEYLNATTKICREARTEFGKLNPDDFPAYVIGGSKILRVQVRALSDLEPPEEQEKNLRRYVVALSAVADAVDDAASRAARGDVTTATSKFKEAGSLAESARKVAKAVGLVSCTA